MLPYRLAHLTDADAIANLLNRAYRPQDGAAGWTHESTLIQGARTNAAQVAAAVAEPDSVFLLHEANGTLLACVQAKRDGDDIAIGMFAVAPEHQGHSLGKALLNAAETYGRDYWRSRRALMSVIEARHELVAFYLRRGYLATGERLPYPHAADAGTPYSAQLPLLVLAKALA